MRENQFSKEARDLTSRTVPRGAAPLPIFPDEVTSAGDRTDPFASEGPMLTSSEWPTSSEIENALLDADPFPTRDRALSSAGDVPDLFGELEPPLPRDTLPSPPPVADEPVRLELPRNQRLP